MSLKEVHQKLNDFGVSMEALSKLPIEEAIELLNYRRAKLKEHASEFIDEAALDSEIEQQYNRSLN